MAAPECPSPDVINAAIADFHRANYGAPVGEWPSYEIICYSSPEDRFYQNIWPLWRIIAYAADLPPFGQARDDFSTGARIRDWWEKAVAHGLLGDEAPIPNDYRPTIYHPHAKVRQHA